MTGTDRIDYNGFTKEYVLQRFELALDKSDEIIPPDISSMDARSIILQNRKGLSGFFVKLAFRFKGIIKRTPLKSIAIRLKNKMLAE